MNYAEVISKPVPQTEKQSNEQVQNNAGGYVFAVDKWQRLKRFLIIGTEGGTYYESERELTLDNALVVRSLFVDARDGIKAVSIIVDVSTRGLAKKNDAAIFAIALACCSQHQDVRKAAYAAVPAVARTGTHLFQFVDAVNKLRGWSRGLRNAVARWYTQKDYARLERQLVKYRQRGKWNHRDVMRLSHPSFSSKQARELAQWVTGKPHDLSDLELVRAYEFLSSGQVTEEGVVDTIKQLALGVPWEIVPTQFLNSPHVLEVLYRDMKPHALVRNLSRLTKAGLISTFSECEKHVVDCLGDAEWIRDSRMHPMALFFALRAYQSGRSRHGDTWTPSPAVLSALEGAFYSAFANVVPSRKPTVVALDVSGSMDYGLPNSNLTVRDAAVAMALVTVRTEPLCAVAAFSNGIVQLPITARTTLSGAIHITKQLRFSSTDCALPFLWVKKSGIRGVGNFAVFTDNETWAGHVHPHVALKDYREFSGADARSVVCGMTASNFTIADPNDPGMLDVVGFSSDTPAVISAFARGEV